MKVKILFFLFIIWGYSVKSQDVIISNTKQNTLFVGILNPIEVGYQGCDFDSVIISTNNGVIEKLKGNTFSIIPKNLGSTIIYSFGVNENDTSIIDSSFFVSKKIEYTITCGGKSNGYISKKALKSQKGLSLRVNEIVCLDIEKTIVSFSIVLFRNNRIENSIYVEGSQFTERVINLIESAHSEDRIVFADVVGQIGENKIHLSPLELMLK